MKRKYAVLKTEVKRRGLAALVEVQELGPTWGFWIMIPWEVIDQREAYEAAEREAERRRKAESGPPEAVLF